MPKLNLYTRKFYKIRKLRSNDVVLVKLYYYRCYHFRYFLSFYMFDIIIDVKLL